MYQKCVGSKNVLPEVWRVARCDAECVPDVALVTPTAAYTSHGRSLAQ